uniref:Uncharacterized protein n=1 Tax=Candidatus Methanogaster sp. ANME-2c ERB4 TaxID=2759911 RepID=A0A7G9YNM7_9EURY|nr:hypothetical protein AIHMFPNM_00012 [Methanosarcinales archaeon ANME-2c ERB4]
MSEIACLWSAGAKVYGAISLSLEIEGIHQRISLIYTNMADAHWKSAKQALTAFRNSEAPDAEIRSAIGHLMEAYNILQVAVETKITERIFIIFKPKFPTQKSKPAA